MGEKIICLAYFLKAITKNNNNNNKLRICLQNPQKEGEKKISTSLSSNFIP